MWLLAGQSEISTLEQPSTLLLLPRSMQEVCLGNSIQFPTQELLLQVLALRTGNPIFVQHEVGIPYGVYLCYCKPCAS